MQIFTFGMLQYASVKYDELHLEIMSLGMASSNAFHYNTNMNHWIIHHLTSGNTEKKGQKIGG